MTVKNRSLFSLALVVIPLLLIQFSNSLDLESAKELSCFKAPKTVPTDLEWVLSVKKWYYIVGSRLDLYECAADLINKDPKYITEDELYYKSCISWEAGEGSTFLTKGFGGKKKSYNVKLLDPPSVEAVEFSSDDGSLSALSYTTLTDNKTFTFSATCYTNSNQMTWIVASPYKSLPSKTIRLVHEHAESLGFNKEYFTGLRYDSCDKHEEDAGNDRNEL